MRQMVTRSPGTIVRRSAPTPAVAAGHVLVLVEVVGLCGSDFHIFDGTHPVDVYPQVQGHEIVGTIHTVGDGVNGLTLGTRVAIEPFVSCDACYACIHGHGNCCSRLQVFGVNLPGGLADYIVVPASQVYPIGGLAPEVGVLIEPFSVGLQAVSRAGLAPGETVLVIGAGSIGRAIVLAASDRGARVLVADRQPSRLEIASRLGAAAVVNTSSHDLSAAVSEFAGVDGAPVVFEATGAARVVREAINIVASSGTVVVVGVSNEQLSIPLSVLTRKEINLFGSRNNRGQFADAVDLVRRHETVLMPLVSHCFALEESQEAMQFARANPRVVSKAIIDLRLGRPADVE